MLFIIVLINENNNNNHKHSLGSTKPNIFILLSIQNRENLSFKYLNTLSYNIQYIKQV